VQAFQSLQIVTQARGNWFLDTTDSLQSVFISNATGGTFTVTCQGQTTPALPYNAPAAQLRAELEKLSTIGAGNVDVVMGQARFINTVKQNELNYIVVFQAAMGQKDVPMLTVDGAALTGATTPPLPTATVVNKRPGSSNPTYLVYLEAGNIFTLEPPPGTYRLSLRVGGLTTVGVGSGDSPFGVNSIDVWIKQPDTGGPAIFEGPWFAPYASSAANYAFRWYDGVEPLLSTDPGDIDIIRLSSYNLTVWVGQHITRLATTTVPVPATSTSPGVSGQIAHDSTYLYTCVAHNTWKRTPLSAW
jgi:hypothetical protein